jgi:hypothetical protein
MNRRGFLGGLLALGVAPAIIRTPGLLMPIRPERVPFRTYKIEGTATFEGALGWNPVTGVICLFTSGQWTELPQRHPPVPRLPSNIVRMINLPLTAAPQALPA